MTTRIDAFDCENQKNCDIYFLQGGTLDDKPLYTKPFIVSLFFVSFETRPSNR